MKSQTPIRLLLVDDHFFIRMGLAGSLNQEEDIQVIAEAASGTEAVAAYMKHQPDVTLMDGRLPDFHGVEATMKIRSSHPKAPIILLSIDETEEDIHRALAAGVRSYLPKSIERDELLLAIRTVYGGGTYFPAGIAQRIAERSKRTALSDRELEVLRQIVLGQANKQIAETLGIAEITVKVHVSHILEKLGVPDRTRASTLAIERGIVKL
ncbi:response regulator transcription factor [soil metagenome]